jgi:hypothetical protein
MIPLRFRLRSLMILVIPTVGIGAWTYRLLPKCPVHGTVLWRGNVPIQYGLLRYSSSEFEYEAARSSAFPNCDDAVQRGCFVQPEKTLSKNICRTCNATRDAWRLNQAKLAPFSSANDSFSSDEY